MKKVLKVFMFIVAWVVSFGSALYLLAALQGYGTSNIDIILYTSGFLLAIVYMLSHIVKD